MGHHGQDFELDPAKVQDFAQGELSFAWLEITQHCNLRCTHCYTTSSPARAHSGIDWLPIIEQIRGAGCSRLQFIGGEPLTHPQIRTYIARARELGFDFLEVYTNAALLDEEMARFLAEHHVNVATSFYSTRPEGHESVTLTPGSLEQTISGIRNCIAQGIVLRVGVIGASGDTESFEEKAAFLVSLGVAREKIGYDAVRPVGRGAKMTPYSSRVETLCGACWNGKLAVSFDGNCYPCIMARDVVVGSILENSIAEIISARALNEFRVSFGAEAIAARAQRMSEREPSADVMADDPCGPDCTPSGPCSPLGCQPSGDCNPYHCTPIEGCTPIDPNCGPSDSTCSPSWICKPLGGHAQLADDELQPAE